jgi:Ca2+-binding RTX toxin-like protein
MAITITLDDANNDGKGINFNAYLKSFDKRFEPSGRGGFVNGYETVTPETGFSAGGDDYVSWDGKRNGQSVIFEGGDEGWAYTFNGPDEVYGTKDDHTMSGDIKAITLGTGTKESSDNPEYTNNGEINIAFDEFNVNSYSKHWLSDLGNGETKGLLNFLNSDAIEFVGSAGRDTFASFKMADTLHGEGGGDTLNGGKGSDTIYGDEGNDKLTGSFGVDTFIFEAGDGKDRITDFGKGADRIDFSGMFDNFDAVIDAANQSNAGVTIEYDGGSVLLMGVKIGDLQEADFVFPI